MLKGRESSSLTTEAIPGGLLKNSEGFHGPLGAAALLLHEDDQIVLSVDFFFTDIPSWLEYDVDTKKLGIVQMGGAVAELNIDVPEPHIIDFEKAKRVLLVTRMGHKRLEMANDQKLIHSVNLIVRR